jgi:hypothetical protein
MILTLQIDDRELEKLKNALKISPEDHDALIKQREPSSPYAEQILLARHALQLATDKPNACKLTEEQLREYNNLTFG